MDEAEFIGFQRKYIVSRKRTTEASREETGTASSSDDEEEAERRRTRARLRRMQLEMQETPVEEDEPDEGDEVALLFVKSRQYSLWVKT